MDLFRIETGAIPAHSCHEESSPMLQNHSSATGRPSKAFLVHDSVSCITNVAFALDESAKTGLLKDRPNESKAFKGKDTGLHMKDHGGKTSPGSPEYQFLSPCNLEDPLSSSLWSTTQTHLAAKPSEKETDCLLQSADSEINHNNKRNQFSSPSTPAIDYSKAGLPSGGHTSTVPTRPDKLSGASTSPENDDGRRKTLEELAKEWRAKQENGPKKDVCWKVESAETHCDDQSLLVRHTDYYTSSGTNGMTSEENRIRNKLKTRLHLNEESVNRMRSHGGQTLVKLAGN